MTNITYRDSVTTSELVVYFPALAIAILLIIRHGFGRSAGWRFLAIFILARIIGACFQLATISQPDSTTLYSGVFVLLNLGIWPLQLTALGLLSRVTISINKTYNTIVTERHIQIISLTNLVGLILIIVGGVEAGESYDSTGGYTPAIESKVGEAIFIFTFIAICTITVLRSFSISHAEPGEKRLLLAVAVSLPFLLTRIIYACIQVYAKSGRFDSVSGNVTILLCMALLEELVVTYLYGIVGLRLKKVDENPAGPREPEIRLRGMKDGQAG